VQQTRGDYVVGLIELEEFERRLDVIFGLRGAEERSVALAPAELVEVTRFGAAEPEFIPTMWRWPFPCSPMD
jgi:hypothetical protein